MPVATNDGMCIVQNTLQQQQNIISDDENQLIQRLVQKDLSTLGGIYTQYGGEIKKLIFYLSPKIQFNKLDQLTQEVFLRLWQEAQYIPPGTKLFIWLCRKAIGVQKKHTFWGIFGCGLYRRIVNDTSPYLFSDNGLRVERALAGLTQKELRIVILHSVLQLNCEEISMILRISPNRTWFHLHSARDILMSKLQGTEFTAG